MCIDTHNEEKTVPARRNVFLHPRAQGGESEVFFALFRQTSLMMKQ